MYVPVHDKIRSKDFTVASNISHRSGGAFNLRNLSELEVRKQCKIKI